MERWKVILLLLGLIGCFIIVGLIEDPADYHLTTKDPYIIQHVVK